ncbi:hypothetical protein EUTSA_v10012191mg, partial [Eutrema salsugineum]
YLKKFAPATSKNDLDDLPSDPADRKIILEYHQNERDEVRRRYLIKGFCQPHGHDFPKTAVGNKLGRFNPSWFDVYGRWLEYSVKKDKVFCLFCYLFSSILKFHNYALKIVDNLMTQGQSIVHAFYKHDDATKNKYIIRLNVSIDCYRYLLQEGLAFRGHDENVGSANRKNFVELLKYIVEQNKIVSKTYIVHCFAEDVTAFIIQELDHDVFCLLIDESADFSDKEQMAVVFRFVDKGGIIKERFIGLIHVQETSSLTLKCVVDSIFAKHGLSMKKLRGQGYDGASNMQGEFNGLRSLILRENGSAYYVYCFSHQLQLVVVAVAKKQFQVADFFDMELSFQRPSNTRWCSHYITLLRSVNLFLSIITVLEYVESEGTEGIKKRQAYDQDISNAMSLVKSTKQQLCKLRDNGWDSLIKKLLIMEEDFVDPKKPRKQSGKTNMHQYQVECFYTVLDMQIQDFNDRFDEIFARVMVETKKYILHPLVYRLLKLALTLSAASASVERCFSVMKIVKTTLRNRMNDQLLTII